MRILWHRLATNPTTRVLSREGEITQLQVEGLACDDICATRTRMALERLPGVRHVALDLDSGIATIDGPSHDPGVYDGAVTSVVAFRPVRRLIEAGVRVLRRRKRPHEKLAG